MQRVAGSAARRRKSRAAHAHQRAWGFVTISNSRKNRHSRPTSSGSARFNAEPEKESTFVIVQTAGRAGLPLTYSVINAAEAAGATLHSSAPVLTDYGLILVRSKHSSMVRRPMQAGHIR